MNLPASYRISNPSMTKIAVYGFANTSHFFQRLIARVGADDDIEWSVILPRWHNRKLFRGLVPDERVLYLYEGFDVRYAATTPVNAAGAFSFSSAADSEFVCLSKDKGGYCQLNGDEQLRRAAVVTEIYREFLLRVRPDYMLFPDLEVVDGFLLMSLCVTLGVRPIYFVGMRTMGGGFLSDDAYETLPPYFGEYTETHLQRAGAFVADYIAGRRVQSAPPASSGAPIPIAPLWRRMLLSAAMHFKYERKYVGEDNWYIRLRANFLPFLTRYRRWHFDAFHARLFDINSLESDALPENFGFYALQYTPESSINGLEPYYVDQFRVIDALLASMPSGYSLLVKEHPAIVGLRPRSFYRELKRRAGVVLVSPDADTRSLLLAARFVATVTGTIGFESYLLGRPCILFGRNFFAHLCLRFKGLDGLKKSILHAITDFSPPTVAERAKQVARLFAISYPIDLGDPIANPAIISEENIRNYHSAIIEHISRCVRAEVSSSAQADGIVDLPTRPA